MGEVTAEDLSNQDRAKVWADATRRNPSILLRFRRFPGLPVV